jgi:hypothetical protein
LDANATPSYLSFLNYFEPSVSTEEQMENHIGHIEKEDREDRNGPQSIVATKSESPTLRVIAVFLGLVE